MAYSGRFVPINKHKYKGDYSNIVYRSLWEKKCMEWFDLNSDVKSWNSEEIVIPYRCKTDGEMHRYFPDFLVEFVSGITVLIEVKPEKQTLPPKNSRNKRALLNEAMTYAKNISKWEAAEEFCKKRNYKFMIWTEKTLENIGVKTQIYARKR